MSNTLLRMALGGMRAGPNARPGSPGRGGCSSRIFLALVVLGIMFVQIQTMTHEVENPFTGEKQRILKNMDPKQEILMGLAAVPQMKQQHGGDHPDPVLQAKIDAIGMNLLRAVPEHPYEFEFHLLADPDMINAFALPGGQIFMTYGLFKLLPSENEVAGVLGHEIGHVIGRHSAEQMATAMQNQGIANAAAVLIGEEGSPQMATMVNHLLTTRYGRDDEYQADELGVQIMLAAGYDPRGLLGVMKVLKQASGGASQPEFMSTHPNPGNRAQRLEELIDKYSSNYN